MFVMYIFKEILYLYLIANIIFFTNTVYAHNGERIGATRSVPSALSHHDNQLAADSKHVGKPHVVVKREVDDESKPSTKKELKPEVNATLSNSDEKNPLKLNITNAAANQQVSEHTTSSPGIAVSSSSPSLSPTVGSNVTAAVTDRPDPTPGVRVRGIIVFGSLGLFCAAYVAYKVYRRRKMERNDNSFYPGDQQQFKYGVLTSNDRMEMSNLPLTGESDDEDEMEIFDLEHRKYLSKGEIDSIGNRGRLLKNEDVEILDMDLPGTSSTQNLLQQAFVSRDDDLLNLEDQDVPTLNVVSSNPINSSYKPTSRKSDELFEL